MRVHGKTLRTLLAAFLVTGGLAACASAPREAHVAEVPDDPVISGYVRTALRADPLCARLPIYVETYRGAVQLSGAVATPEQKTRAAEIARAAPGVRSVTNELELPPAAGGSGQDG